MSSSSDATTKFFKKLCLLPPPFNDAGPTFVSALSFAAAVTLLGKLEVQSQWSALVANRDERLLWVFVPFVLYLVVYWPWSVALKLLDQWFPEFMLQFKIQPKQPTATWAEIVTALPLVLLNHLVTLPALLITMYTLRKTFGLFGGEAWIQSKTTEVPSPLYFFGYFLLQSLLADIVFYVNHRTLHEVSFLYQHVHSWHHKYPAPTCGFATAYLHPLEGLLTVYAVLVFVPYLAGCPLLVFYAWFLAVGVYQVHDHSGVWLPLLPRALMHDYHHERFQCCFGVLGIVDQLAGTTGGLAEHVAQKEEETKTYLSTNTNDKKET